MIYIYVCVLWLYITNDIYIYIMWFNQIFQHSLSRHQVTPEALIHEQRPGDARGLSCRWHNFDVGNLWKIYENLWGIWESRASMGNLWGMCRDLYRIESIGLIHHYSQSPVNRCKSQISLDLSSKNDKPLGVIISESQNPGTGCVKHQWRINQQYPHHWSLWPIQEMA